MTPDVEQEVQTTYRRTLIIMIVVGLSIVAVLGFNLFFTESKLLINRDYGMIRMSFTVVVLFLGFGAVILRRYMFREIKLATICAAGGIKGLLKHLSATSTFLAAMTEIAAILGLVFGLITGDSSFATSLILVGLAVFLVSFPRRRSWLRAAAAAEEAC